MSAMAVAAPSLISNASLNNLLIDVGRSLLQYADESCLWASSGEEQTQRSLERMAAEQRDVVSALADLLAERGHVIDFGTYPTDYTSLHYVSVDYLTSQLIANQAAVLAKCESVAKAMPADDPATSLLSDIVVSERKHLDELQELSSSR